MLKRNQLESKVNYLEKLGINVDDLKKLSRIYKLS